MTIDFDPCSSPPFVARATPGRALSVKARAVVLEVVVQMLPAQIGEQILLIAFLPASSFVPDWCVRSFSLIAGPSAGRPLL